MHVCVCVCVCVCPLRVWEPHSGAGVNILLENGQYPHNSS